MSFKKNIIISNYVNLKTINRLKRIQRKQKGQIYEPNFRLLYFFFTELLLLLFKGDKITVIT